MKVLNPLIYKLLTSEPAIGGNSAAIDKLIASQHVLSAKQNLLGCHLWVRATHGALGWSSSAEVEWGFRKLAGVPSDLICITPMVTGRRAISYGLAQTVAIAWK